MTKLHLFGTNELKPSGWLKRQLEIQADGLSGNLDKIWPDVRDSRWVGGNREGWERVPYWLDGFIPLAYILDDEDKIARAKRYIDAIAAGQQEDGWLCPCTMEERAGYDMWALYLIDKVLMLYYDCSGDERIPEIVYKSLINLHAHIKEHPIFSWAHTRWFECLIPIFRVYEIYKDEELLELARLLRKQGMNYEELYTDWQYKQPENKWQWPTHVVNQGMAIKEGALASLLDGNEADDSFSEYMLSQLFEYHGTAVGHFTGDECLAGISPIQGTELCGVAEAMYSYEVLYSVTGNPVWADRLEKLAFNAFPATNTPDMWGHQYDQMTNQVAAVKMQGYKVPFLTNGPDSNIYGLEPNYGCCTANHNQAWPKFAMSVMMKADDGITVCAIAPAVLNTKIGDASVSVESDTIYPFGSSVNYIVKTDSEVEFTLTLRVPSCVKSAKIDGEDAEAGTLVSLKRVWSGTSVVTLEMEFDVKYIDRPTGLHSIERGPLVYALDIGEKWNNIEYESNGVERKFPYCDHEILPTSEWQYALTGGDIAVHETGVIGDYPFAPESSPLWLDVPACRINWGYETGCKLVARHEPLSAMPIGPEETVKFIPYGCTNIRVTELPYAERTEKMKKHNLGIIGFGGMAEYHYNTCRREDIGMDCLAVFDIREERRKRAVELGMTAYDNLEDFLADKRFDLVLVATANNFHCYYACKAMEAGYNVITEKPTAMSSEEVKKMIETSEKCGVFYTVHQNRRFDRDFRMIMKALDTKLIGEPFEINSHCMHRNNSGCMYNWRGMVDHGGGMLFDWGVHMLDQLLWYIDEDPVSVYAVIRTVNSEEVDDNTRLIMRFKSGLSVQMQVTTFAPITYPRFLIYGSKGAIKMDAYESENVEVRYVKEGTSSTIDAPAYARDTWDYRKQGVYNVKEFEETLINSEGINDDWGSIYKNLYNVLEGKEELFVKPYQVLRVIRVIEAAFKSNETGEAVKL